MKSSDIKNWGYELSYSEMVELDDFTELLTEAITKGTCLICGGIRTDNTGLCLGCSMHLKGKDKEAMEKVLKNYEVSITVKKRNKSDDSKRRLAKRLKDKIMSKRHKLLSEKG